MGQLLPFRFRYVYQIECTNFLRLFELGLRRPVISEMKELVKRKIDLIMKFLILDFFFVFYDGRVYIHSMCYMYVCTQDPEP